MNNYFYHEEEETFPAQTFGRAGKYQNNNRLSGSAPRPRCVRPKMFTLELGALAASLGWHMQIPCSPQVHKLKLANSVIATPGPAHLRIGTANADLYRTAVRSRSARSSSPQKAPCTVSSVGGLRDSFNIYERN